MIETIFVLFVVGICILIIPASILLERLNREIKRRTDVVQVFPNDGAAVRLAGAVLLETADEWAVERRYFSQASMQRLTDPTGVPVPIAPALAPVR